MRKALIQRNPQRQQSAIIQRIASPTHGWFSLENVVTQPDQTASYMENFYPDPFAVRARRGYKEHAFGMREPVLSLIPFNGFGGDEKLFAAALSRLWDVTEPGKAKLVGYNITPGPGSEEFVWCAFTVAGGPHTIASNRTNPPLIYDGIKWAEMVLTEETGTLNIRRLDSPWAYRSRLFFIEADSNRAWFLPPDSISGKLDPVDLGGIFTRGGTLIAGGAWSVDTQVGPKESCVFISSKGEVAIYSGDNPADPKNWQLDGVVRIAEPLTRRCTIRVGGDLYVLTTDGIMPMSQATVIDVAQDRKVLLTSNINNAFVDAVEDAKKYPGWQLYQYATGHTVYLNVPVTPDGNSVQYIMNTITGAWSRYTGMNATTWASLGDRIFFGTKDGRVMEAECAGSDDGQPITCRMVTSFNMFGEAATVKNPKMVRAILQTSATNPQVGITVCSDYDIRIPNTVPVTEVVPGLQWDVGFFDEGNWGGLTDRRVQMGWKPVVAPPGRALAISLSVRLRSTDAAVPVKFSVLGFDLVFDHGNTL